MLIRGARPPLAPALSDNVSDLTVTGIEPQTSHPDSDVIIHFTVVITLYA